MMIVSVQPESAASDAGLEAGDLVRKVNGKLVSDPTRHSFRLIQIVKTQGNRMTAPTTSSAGRTNGQ